jgi:hypothetical protein
MGRTSKNKRNNSVSDEHEETKDSLYKPLNKKPKTTDSTVTPSIAANIFLIYFSLCDFLFKHIIFLIEFLLL